MVGFAFYRGSTRILRSISFARYLEALRSTSSFAWELGSRIVCFRQYWVHWSSLPPTDVLGERADVSYHLVFGMLGHEHEFARHARLLVSQLHRGCPVYVSSLGYPERDVLDRVYTRFDTARSLAEVATLPTDEFIKSFPRYQLDAIDIDAASEVQVLRLVPR